MEDISLRLSCQSIDVRKPKLSCKLLKTFASIIYFRILDYDSICNFLESLIWWNPTFYSVHTESHSERDLLYKTCNILCCSNRNGQAITSHLWTIVASSRFRVKDQVSLYLLSYCRNKQWYHFKIGDAGCINPLALIFSIWIIFFLTLFKSRSGRSRGRGIPPAAASGKIAKSYQTCTLSGSCDRILTKKSPFFSQ